MILHEKYHIPYRDGGISHSYTKNRKYYLCSREYNMNALEKLRKVQTIG